MAGLSKRHVFVALLTLRPFDLDHHPILASRPNQ